MVERLLSLYKAASGFHDRGLLGVLDLGAWSCRTPKMVKDLLSKKMLRSSRSSKPMYLATDLVKIPKGDEEIWFCTKKGFHRFSSPDYAYLGTASEAESIRDIFKDFFDIIDYIQGIEFDKNQFIFGDTEGVISDVINTRKVYEYFDYFNSPSDTYVLERTTIDPSLEKSLQSNNRS